MYTIMNPPSFAKNKTKEEQEVAVQAVNSSLAKGASEEDAIFSAIAQVKAYNRKQSQQKAVEAPKRVLPSHLLDVLQKAVVEPLKPSDEQVKEQPKIRKEFLGKNALPVGTDRNLVSVELKDNNELIHLFDTGEQIKVDLSRLTATVENYVNFTSTSQGTGGSSVNSFTTSVNTTADLPLIVEHNLDLLDPDALIFSAYLNGRLVDLELQILDGNSVEILTYVDTVGLKLNFLGL